MLSNPAAALGAARFFQGLETEALEEVASSAVPRSVPAGGAFFHQEEPAERCYVLLDGQVRQIQLTPEGQQVQLGLLVPPDGFGVLCVFPGATYPFTAEALQDSQAASWDRETLRRLMSRHPLIAYNALQIVSGRYVALQARYQELATMQVERRIARALLRLARQVGRREEDGVHLDMPLSRQALGEMTGTNLSTVSRVLSRWEREGLVRSGRQRVVIAQPHGLVAIAEDLPG